LFLSVLFCLVSTVRAEFTLVDVGHGIAPAPLVLFDDAPPKTREAAVELADYVEKVCGGRPELIEGTPQPLPERAVWIGYQPALDELLTDIDFDFKHPDYPNPKWKPNRANDLDRN